MHIEATLELQQQMINSLFERMRKTEIESAINAVRWSIISALIVSLLVAVLAAIITRMVP